jgi:hypothetical protein
MTAYDTAQTLSKNEKLALSFRLIVQQHKGAENAISKADLANKLIPGSVTISNEPHAMPRISPAADRALRLIQDELIDQGYIICTNQQGGGYYEPKTFDEGREYINRVIQSRINSLTEKRDNAYQALNEKFSIKNIIPVQQQSLF